MRKLTITILFLLPVGDLIWNLVYLNIGLVDFYGLAAFARNFALHQVWPATPYFPAGYPILLAAGGKLGSVLFTGYFLSAIGCAVALWMVFRLLRHWGAGYGWALTAAILAWVSPTCRIAAGSPSVDSLFTGLALWFLGSALVVWDQPRVGVNDLPRWARLGLAIPALVLPLLRYHGLLVILPILVVLLVARRRHWQLTAVAVLAVALAASFNTLTYQRAFQEPLLSAAVLQVRTGIEINQPTHYASADALFADYRAFADHGRTTPLLDDYSLDAIARHVGTNLMKFLRRPPVALALVLALFFIVTRRRTPGLVIGTAWLCCYSLALSSAYYTPRGALLVTMLAIALVCTAIHHLLDDNRMKYLQGGVAVLLLIGYGMSVSYAKLVIDDRVGHSMDSIELSNWTHEIGMEDVSTIAVTDMALLPRHGNPWCRSYAFLSQSWLSDPAICRDQVAGMLHLSLEEALRSGSGIHYLIVQEDSPQHDAVKQHTEWWEAYHFGGDLVVFTRFGSRKDIFSALPLPEHRAAAPRGIDLLTEVAAVFLQPELT